MKTHRLTLILVFSWCFGFTQNIREIDSLKIQLGSSEQDSVKVKVLVEICNFYRWVNPDSTLKYATEGLRLAEKLNYIELQIQLLNAQGEALSGKGNFPQALETQFKALKLCDNIKDDQAKVWPLIAVGVTYYYSGDFPNSLKYFKQAQRINKLDENYLSIICFIGESYFSIGQIDSALFYIQKSYNLEIQKKDGHWSIPYFFMAAINLKIGNTSEAIKYFRAGLDFETPAADSINGYLGLAGVFKVLKNNDSTIYYANKALLLSQKLSFTRMVYDASLILKDIYKSNNTIDSAYKYQEILIEATDSLYSQEKIKQLQNLTFSEQTKLQELRSAKIKYLNQVKTIVLLITITFLLIIGFLLWRRNLYKQRAFEILQSQNKEIELQKNNVENALTQLKSTQSQLIQTAKMASLGELTAGIAHEIQNPLNFVNNFSEVNSDLIDELREEADKGNLDEVKAIAKDIKENEQKISHHGKRAGEIVKGMLQLCRTSNEVKELTDINALADEYLRFAYHGMKAKDKSFNVHIKTDFDETLPKINVIPRDIGRVLLNLINNAFYAVDKRAKSIDPLTPKGGTKNDQIKYVPTVTVSSISLNPPSGGRGVKISVKDNGPGIPAHIVDKIFQPFFTTKPTGQGSGLGLSLAYDIVKAHGGELKVETNEGEGSEFIVQLPLS